MFKMLATPFAQLLPSVWQAIERHLKYGRPKPTEYVVKMLSELQNLVVALADKNGRKGPVSNVKLAGTPCRCDKLYDNEVAPGAAMHKLK